MEFRNARYLEDGRIDCEVNHPRLGWVPCTLSSGDPHTAAMAEVASATAAPYVPQEPDPAAELAVWRATARASRFQARAALHSAGLLPSVEEAIAGADAIVQIAWADAVEFRRLSPTILALAATLGLTDSQLDALFQQAMTIEA